MNYEIQKKLWQKSITKEQAKAQLNISEKELEDKYLISSKISALKTKLKDAQLIKPQVFGDHRGFFLESYSQKTFKNLNINNNFIQDNHSMSTKTAVLRGLHFQTPPFAQAKLVRVTKGAVYDVIIDLRKDSPTYGQWEGFNLSADNKLMLFIPRGFAHGFCTLEPNTEFMYKVDNNYSAEHDSGIIWNDSDLDINWPTKKPILSDKDKNLQTFRDFESPF